MSPSFCRYSVLASLLLAAGVPFAGAATYQYKVYVASLTGAAQGPLALSAAALPAATRMSPYSYDFKPLLGQGAAPPLDATAATWKVTGPLPEGLALTSQGVLSGMPTVRTAGERFQVEASLAGRAGVQSYTLVVNGLSMDVTQIAAGETHTCAVTTGGEVYCWGSNNLGQLGTGGNTSTQVTPVRVGGQLAGVPVARLAATTYQTCAVTKGGAVYCWGAMQTGDRSVWPVAVPGLGAGVVSVSLSPSHACALLADGTAKCWGTGWNGQLGTGNRSDQLAPAVVTVVPAGITALEVGTSYTCALAGGRVKCWGYNGYGQLGDGTQTERLAAAEVTGLPEVVGLSVGDTHVCALTAAGKLVCWGNNATGQVGTGTAGTWQLTPFEVGGLESVSQVSAGTFGTCAITTAGAARCWGRNDAGQAGDGTSGGNKLTPSVVAGLSGAALQLSAGASHNCAVTQAGSAQCWGSGPLGTPSGQSPTAATVVLP